MISPAKHSLFTTSFLLTSLAAPAGALTINYVTASTPIFNAIAGMRAATNAAVPPYAPGCVGKPGTPVGELGERDAVDAAIARWEGAIDDPVVMNLYIAMQQQAVFASGLGGSPRRTLLQPAAGKPYGTARQLLIQENLQSGANHAVVANLPAPNELKFRLDGGVKFRDAAGAALENEDIPILLTASQHKALLGVGPGRVDSAPDFYSRVQAALPSIGAYVGTLDPVILDNAAALLPELNLRATVPAWTIALTTRIPHALRALVGTDPVEVLMSGAIVGAAVGFYPNAQLLVAELQVFAGLDGTVFIATGVPDCAGPSALRPDYDPSDGIGIGTIDWSTIPLTNFAPDFSSLPQLAHHALADAVQLDFTGLVTHPMGHSLGLYLGSGVQQGQIDRGNVTADILTRVSGGTVDPRLIDAVRASFDESLGVSLVDLFRIQESELWKLRKAKDYGKLRRMLATRGALGNFESADTVWVSAIPDQQGNGAVEFHLMSGGGDDFRHHNRANQNPPAGGNGYTTCPAGIGPNALFQRDIHANDQWVITQQDLTMLDYVGWDVDYSGIPAAFPSDCISGN